MKKVLIISYYWPPSGGSGVQRWMYFAKYLSDFGYHPVILTVNPEKASYKNTDRSFAEKVKHVEVHMSTTFEPLKLYSFLTTGTSSKGIPQGHAGTNKKGIFSKLTSYIRANYFIPDARVGWNGFAIKKAKEIIENQDISLIITTGPPQSSHLIGLALKKTNPTLRWIADFRDPWTDIYYNKELNRTAKAKKRDTELELEVLSNCDQVLTVGFKLKDMLQRKLGANSDKFYHIYNGYDSTLMDSIRPPREDWFEVTFIGLLTPRQPYQAIVDILKAFIDQTDTPNFRIRLAGNVAPEIIDTFNQTFSIDRIISEGYIEHKEAILLMKKSDLLLNILAEMEGSEILISGKQMEYIATGNPILCIGNTKGESAHILKDIKNARIFEKNELAKSVAFVNDIYAAWKLGTPLRNDVKNADIKTKSRYETTRQLSKLLNNK